MRHPRREVTDLREATHLAIRHLEHDRQHWTVRQDLALGVLRSALLKNPPRPKTARTRSTDKP